MYAEFATDPKVQMLNEVDQRRFVMLLCLRCNASETFQETNGNVSRNVSGGFSDDEICFQLRVNRDEWMATKSVLLAKGMIQEDNLPANWDRRQFSSDHVSERVRRHRDKSKKACNASETLLKRSCNGTDTDTDTEADTEYISTPNGVDVASDPAADLLAEPEKPKKAQPPPCPHQRIIDLYHETLPTLPRVREWHNTRQGYLQSRWREKLAAGEYATTDEGVAWWRRYFAYVAKSDFLCGRTQARNDRQPFVADLEWLVKPTNFAKVIEGKYENQESRNVD
ncbi:MAG: hypothetical protein LBE75_03040, partial [Burkholderiales bacterium]|jgi:hypothetical protein|nr:hypothetical protein [Burkholderiales bacterium]